MLRTRLILILLMSFLPLGCVNWQSVESGGVLPTADASGIDSRPAQTIALDFVKTLQQLEPLRPDRTTVHFSSASRSDEFTLHMQRALQSAGYGVRWVSDNSSEPLFQYRHDRDDGQRTGQRDTYEVAVGSVELRRSYFTDALAVVKPVSPLYIRGADASRIVLDDTHFTVTPAAQGQSPAAAALLSAPETPGRQSSAVNTAGTLLSVPDAANPLDLRVSSVNRRQGLTLPLTTLTRVENVFELGASNYEDMLAGHRVMRELILTFPNDSLRLGEANKRLVEQMVSYYQPESDVFSVLGCSLGPTQLKSGNVALALGRASRVREALLFAGIPQDRILDEGCWAGDSSGNSLPRRGVVVTLNRQV